MAACRLQCTPHARLSSESPAKSGPSPGGDKGEESPRLSSLAGPELTLSMTTERALG